MIEGHTRDWYEKTALECLAKAGDPESTPEDMTIFVASAQVFATLAVQAAIREKVR